MGQDYDKLMSIKGVVQHYIHQTDAVIAKLKEENGELRKEVKILRLDMEQKLKSLRQDVNREVAEINQSKSNLQNISNNYNYQFSVLQNQLSDLDNRVAEMEDFRITQENKGLFG